jgi:hypothetical protein
LGAGALSDAKVVEKTGLLVPVLVDCSSRSNRSPLLAKYDIQGFPTVLFLDSEGAAVDKLGQRDPASVIAKIESVAGGQVSATPPTGAAAPSNTLCYWAGGAALLLILALIFKKMGGG